MAYKLEISEQADHQIDKCIGYLVNSLRNPSEARTVLQEIACAYGQLEHMAESFSEGLAAKAPLL